MPERGRPPVGIDSLTSVDNLAVRAATDELCLEHLIKAYKPFIYSQVKSVSGLAYVDDHHDLAAVGLVAFHEAVQEYDPAKGRFLSLAGVIVRRRVIDEMRSESRGRIPQVPLEVISPDGTEEDNYELDRATLNSYMVGVSQSLLQMEIEQLSAELGEYGIDWDAVYRDAPKHKAGRLDLLRLIAALVDDRQLLHIILTKKYLPVESILKLGILPRKKIEKTRRYIIASLLISTGDYPMLKEYLQLERGRASV